MFGKRGAKTVGRHTTPAGSGMQAAVGLRRRPRPSEPLYLRGFQAGYRSGYKALSRDISGLLSGISRYKFGCEAPELMPIWAPYNPTYNLTQGLIARPIIALKPRKCSGSLRRRSLRCLALAVPTTMPMSDNDCTLTPQRGRHHRTEMQATRPHAVGNCVRLTDPHPRKLDANRQCGHLPAVCHRSRPVLCNGQNRCLRMLQQTAHQGGINMTNTGDTTNK